jgi:transposase
MIGRILGIDRSAVKLHFQKGTDHLDKASPNGRPSILSDEEHEDFIRTITEAYQMRWPMSVGEISYYIETRFQKSIERNTVWHMLRRDTRIKF